MLLARRNDQSIFNLSSLMSAPNHRAVHYPGRWRSATSESLSQRRYQVPHLPLSTSLLSTPLHATDFTILHPSICTPLHSTPIASTDTHLVGQIVTQDLNPVGAPLLPNSVHPPADPLPYLIIHSVWRRRVKDLFIEIVVVSAGEASETYCIEWRSRLTPGVLYEPILASSECPTRLCPSP